MNDLAIEQNKINNINNKTISHYSSLFYLYKNKNRTFYILYILRDRVGIS